MRHGKVGRGMARQSMQWVERVYDMTSDFWLLMDEGEEWIIG